MNAEDREARDAAMVVPEWHYEPPRGGALGAPTKTYRASEMAALPREFDLALYRRAGSSKASLVHTVYMPDGMVTGTVHLSPLRAIALRNALNDYLAEVRQEATT